MSRVMICLICDDEEFGCLPEIVVGILRAEFRMRNRYNIDGLM